MKRLIAVILVLVFNANASSAQSKLRFPTLQQLETYSKTITSNSEFKAIAKTYGFAFESKNEFTGRTDYVYVRKTTIKGIVYTDKCTYTSIPDVSTGLVAFSSTRDLEALYSPAMKKYASVDCQGESESNELHSCFRSKTHFIRLVDVSKEFDDGTKGNSYTIRIYSL